MPLILSNTELISREYILYLSRLGLNKSRKERTCLVNEDRWDDFLALAAKEGCTGLIYYNSTHYQSSCSIPKSVRDHLEQEYLTNTGRNLLMNAQLEEICRCFEDRKLSALTVRGAVFFDQIYPEIGMRPLIDLDFVVHKEDFDKTQNILHALGFQNNACYPYFFFKDDIYVDVHLDSINFWRIKDWPSAIDMTNEELWGRTHSFREFQFIRTLDRYDSVIHSCEHLMRHSFERLIWFLDIAYLLKGETPVFQWDQFIQRAQKFRALKAVYYVMAYLNKMDLCAVPSQVLAELNCFSMNIVEKKNLQLLLADQRTNVSGDLMSVFAIPGFWKKVQILWNSVFIESDKFPFVRERLTVMSYVQRFFRLLGQISRKSFVR